MRTTHFVLSLFVATALAPVSWADDDHEKSKPQLGADGGKHGGDDSKHGGDDNDKRDGAKHDMGHDGGAEADEDESKGEDKDEPAEHKGKRRGYIHKIKKELDEAVHANGKDLSDDETVAIKDHWHDTMRLWRIRHLAEADKDKATVARVDALLSKIDAHTLGAIKALNAKAPNAAGGSK